MTDRTDNFNRAGPGLGANWTQSEAFNALGHTIVISASTIVKESTATQDAAAYWTADTFTSDQNSQVTLNATSDGGGPIVRHQSGASTFYDFYLNGTGGSFTYFECTAGSFAALGANGSVAPNVGDIIKLVVAGSVLTGSVAGVNQATRTDSTITGGSPGFHIFDTAASWDNWQGGPISGVSISAPSVQASMVIGHPVREGPFRRTGFIPASPPPAGPVYPQDSVLQFARPFSLKRPFSEGPFKRKNIQPFATLQGAATLALTANAGVYTYTGTAATLAVSMSAAGGSYTYTGTNATLGAGINASGTTYVYTGTAATFQRGIILPLASSTYVYTGTAATLAVAMPLSGSTYVYTGTAPTLAVAISLSGSTYVYTGTAPTLAVAIPLSSSSYSYTGTAATFGIGMPLAGSSYTYTGASVTLGAGINIPSGSYVYTGTNAALAVAILLSSGSYLYSGTDASLSLVVGSGGSHLTFDIPSGTYIVTGTDSAFLKKLGFTVPSGVYTYTGTSISLNVGISLNSGNYTYSGTDATFPISLSLVPPEGQYLYSGIDSNLIFVSSSPQVGGRDWGPKDWSYWHMLEAHAQAQQAVHDAAVRLGTSGGIASGVSRRRK